MKKILTSLLVLALVAPAMADVTITCTEVGSGDGHLRISVLPSGDAEVRGIALKLARTSGDAAIDATTDATVTQYNTPVDYYATQGITDGNADNIPDDPGHPLAEPDLPGGELDLTGPRDTFVLCSGYLDHGGSQAGVTVESFFDVTYDLTAESCITITEDQIRGGVQGDDLGNVVIVGSPVCLAAPVVEDCVIDDPDTTHYEEWLGSANPATPTLPWAKPDCWCHIRQCRGNVDGVKEGLFQVTSTDLNILLSVYNLGDKKLSQTTICADLDHIKEGLFRVTATDLGLLLPNYNQGDKKYLYCPADWDGDGNDDFFLITP
jgi:hypothetical protein